MQYGGITLNHVLAFQIRIMMGNQYGRLADAMQNDDKDGIIAACLRLAWNDAFRHTSENTAEANNMSERDKQDLIVKICGDLCGEFRAYTKLKSTEDRHAYIRDKMKCPDFTNKFKAIKVIDRKNGKKNLCFGHIQKMFNMALKLYLCLKICAEQAPEHQLDIILRYGATDKETVRFKPELFDLLSGDDVSADCPIDHYILEAIDEEITEREDPHTPIKPGSRAGIRKFGSIAWSKINDQDDGIYIDIQKEIAALQGDPNKWRLCFDFENWNS